ncbi:hypothetical protein D3870_07305 [Noviherbaspirillum cavernae]|uniref:GIY-YIG domain-containing protein n=1 Tax=Noviherbaspirillum cavernae TaxID=2320862 RepID=A0A418X016_9BURK|nr:hypothetical protein [Noviherbaspirillum cavernae]RJG05848.1 hypothetical protein D3870_07305 [Noviherbaspirillum cavernae]
MRNLLSDLDQFYTLLTRLEAAGQGEHLGSYSGRARFPLRGVYFFHEPGEYRRSHPNSPRIVRVGTHAVSANAKSTLWQRLRTHCGTRAGGGNHRGSVFRRHIGAALIARDGLSLPTWGVGQAAPPRLRESVTNQLAEAACEREVSAYIGAMPILWVDVPDAPGPTSERAFIERNAIALLSQVGMSTESASRSWLGLHSPRSEIRSSRLWNVDYTGQTYDPRFLNVLATAVERTVKQHL